MSKRRDLVSSETQLPEVPRVETQPPETPAPEMQSTESRPPETQTSDALLSPAARLFEVELSEAAMLFDAHRQEAPAPELRQRLYAIELDVVPRARLVSWPVAVAAAALAAAAVMWWSVPHSNPLELRAEPTLAVPELTMAINQPAASPLLPAIGTVGPRTSAVEKSAMSTAEPLPVSTRHDINDTGGVGQRFDAKPAPALSVEFDSLRRVREALASGDTTAALHELDRYERDIRRGQLRAEASLLRIEALSKRGDKTTAAKLAAQFVDRHPNSPLVDRARTFLAPTDSATGGPGRIDQAIQH